MVFLGVDPGWSGGITVIGTHVVDCVAMPAHEKAIWKFLEPWSNMKDVVGCLERVHSMPTDGVASAFKFGTSYGALRMALVTAGIPFLLVEPRSWQSQFGLLKLEDEGNSAHKTRIGVAAKNRFPDVTIPRVAYDSVFIAEYARLNYPRGL